MVIASENVVDEIVCVSLRVNALGKGMNPSVLALSNELFVGLTEFFSLS